MNRTDYCMLASFIYTSHHMSPIAGLAFGAAFGLIGIVLMFLEKKR